MPKNDASYNLNEYFLHIYHQDQVVTTVNLTSFGIRRAVWVL